MSGLGSIDHVLKTAFKHLYDEDQRRLEALSALKEAEREISLQNERDENELKQREEVRLKASAEAEAKKSKGKKNDVISSKKDKLKSKSTLPLTDSLKAIRVEEDVDNNNEDTSENRLKTNISSQFFNPFDKLYLDESLKDELTQRCQVVEDRADAVRQSAVQVIRYLDIQTSKARLEEEFLEEDLKRKGIIVGQHIPCIKSKLIIDRLVLEDFGPIASNLVIASELMNENHIAMLRRSGNMQITEEAEQRSLQRIHHKLLAANRSGSLKAS